MNQKEKNFYSRIEKNITTLLTSYNPEIKTFVVCNRMKYLALLALEKLQDARTAIQNKEPRKALKAYKEFKSEFLRVIILPV